VRAVFFITAGYLAWGLAPPEVSFTVDGFSETSTTISELSFDEQSKSIVRESVSSG